eukprot:TRINITY_DN488_c0_g2_i1.p1 TRINITY_DN488_c0_g2~~TRINITY_DN488_c0_g2_i1.p1  ORF type:complete len:281 (+),score=74.38 TRINITY_DN488_c0_g2_i1:46-888(+)
MAPSLRGGKLDAPAFMAPAWSWSAFSSVAFALLLVFAARSVMRKRRRRKTLGTPIPIEPISERKKRHESWIRADVRLASCEAAYRRLVRLHIRSSDSVVELGCHCGTTTALARSLCSGRVIGIDTSEFNLAKARREQEGCDIEWVQEDATDASKVRAVMLSNHSPDSGSAVAASETPLDGNGEGDEDSSPVRSNGKGASDPAASAVSVVLLDISGSRAPGTLVELIAKYDRVLRPRLIIVKSYKLYSFVSKASCVGGGARWIEGESDELLGEEAGAMEEA